MPNPSGSSSLAAQGRTPDVAASGGDPAETVVRVLVDDVCDLDCRRPGGRYDGSYAASLWRHSS